MRQDAGLTRRELQYAELMAWGGATKEVADRLQVSIRTVENTLKGIYRKIGIQKVTELAVWWFVTHHGVPISCDPWKRQMVAIFFLVLILPKEFGLIDLDMLRCRSGRRARVENVQRIKRTEI